MYLSLKFAHKKEASSFSFIRDMKNFQLERFIDDLSQNFSDFSVENSDQVASLLNKFIFIFAALVDKHASIKQASRTEKRLRWSKSKMDANLQRK